MSQLDSFRFVFQVRRANLLDLMNENITLQGQSLEGPVRLVLTGPPTGLPPRRLNSVDLLVVSTDLSLDPGTNLCTLILRLEGGVIRLAGEPDVPFVGGTVNVRVELVDGFLLFARLLSATLDAPATPVIAGIASFAARANTEVNKLFQAEPQKDFDLFPEPSSVKLLFALFGRNLNLDGDTFSVRNGEGNASLLTPFVNSGRPAALAIASSIVTTNLPDPASLSVDPVTVTGLTLTFRDNGIDLDGTFDAEDTCWSIDGGTFSQRLIPRLAQNNIQVIADPPQPDLHYHVDVDFLCDVLIDILSVIQTVILPITPLLGATWRQIFDNIAPAAPVTQVPAQPSWEIPGIDWVDLRVSPEGLLLAGIRGSLTSTAPPPAIHLRTQYDPQNLHGAAAGTVSVQAPTCSAQTFAYEESIQDDRITVTIDTDRLFEPVDYLWTLNGQALASSGTLAVIGGNGETVLKFTQTVTTALPPPNGTAIADHAVELRYRLSGASRGPDSRLVLNARSQDANYDVRVEVRAMDALGRHFSDAVNLKLVGDIVEFGDDYDEYLDKCLKATADIVNKKGRTKSKVKVGDPRENWRDLVTAFTQQVHEGNPEAGALVPAVTKAIGVEAVGLALAGRALTKGIR